jgi:uncharacterized protein YyaL (SSP411 family)
MADFVISMQLPEGGFRTRTPQEDENSLPTVFNTGQDLFGLAATYKQTKKEKYRESGYKAANFLTSIQEKNGSWIKFTYGNTTHTYHTRVALGILMIYEITKDQKLKKSAIKSLNWASLNQLKNGWLKNCHMPSPNPADPYSHTYSYAIEGFLDSGILLNEDRWIKIAAKAAEPLLRVYLKNNFMPAIINKNWNKTERFTCLTGNAQISRVWLKLFSFTGNKDYMEGALRMNYYLKSTQDIQNEDKNIKGGIKGSQPIFGDLFKNKGYCRMAYLNWATKFFIDALLEEEDILTKND